MQTTRRRSILGSIYSFMNRARHRSQFSSPIDPSGRKEPARFFQLVVVEAVDRPRRDGARLTQISLQREPCERALCFVHLACNDFVEQPPSRHSFHGVGQLRVAHEVAQDLVHCSGVRVRVQGTCLESNSWTNIHGERNSFRNNEKRVSGSSKEGSDRPMTKRDASSKVPAFDCYV
jgi:hypothetical protein